MDNTTKEIMYKTSVALADKFIYEFNHLYLSGSYDPNRDSIGCIIRVALENVANLYDRGDSRTYRNLKKV